MNTIIELWSLLYYLIVQGFGLVLAALAAVIFLYVILRKLHSPLTTGLLVAFFGGAMLFFWFPIGVPKNLEYPFGITTYGPAEGPTLPLKNVFAFFGNLERFLRIVDIARDPNDIPPPITRTEPATVYIELTAREVISEIAPGVLFNYWTFDDRVPGPFLRVREGDTLVLTLKNDPSSLHHHSIDLHAVTGPGGGAVATMVEPGETKTLTFKALNPGLYVYHCAEPNVANHMTHGMYGLILVEPEGGLPPVDKEFYVMQGEFYTTGKLGRSGLQVFDAMSMLDGKPQYVVWNGRVGGLAQHMQAATGQTVRMFVGNGGVNLVSSFHVIGEIFDRVYPEAAIGSEPHTNVQSTLVPAGGATIVEFGLEVPGRYVLVDHALARLDRGAWGLLTVSGEPNPSIFEGEIGPGGEH